VPRWSAYLPFQTSRLCILAATKSIKNAQRLRVVERRMENGALRRSGGTRFRIWVE
jgi:hypothetical protein